MQYDEIPGATAGGTNHFNPGRDKYERDQADMDSEDKSGKFFALSKQIKGGDGQMRNKLAGVCAANDASLIWSRE